LIDKRFIICYTIYIEAYTMKDPLVEDLKSIIRTLSKEIRELRDENESLWLMLEEIKDSDKALKKQLDASEQEALIEFLAQQHPVGEA
tara:strand:+ start:57 stop:320 length:264 start_codon:yes stop_codon:yes gene_type:complete